MIQRTHRNILISTQEMTPPSSSRGVGGAERAPELLQAAPRQTVEAPDGVSARLRGVQQHLRSTGAGRGRSSSSSIGSMLEPRSRRGRALHRSMCNACRSQRREKIAPRPDHNAASGK